MHAQIPEWYYPITKESLENFVTHITKAIKVKQNITFVFKPFLGGDRAWLKFILHNPSLTSFKNTLSTATTCYLDPSDCLDSSPTAFCYLLYQNLNPTKKIPPYSSFSLQSIISKLNQKLDIFSTQKPLIIFLAKLDSYPNLNPEIGNLLYSLWKDRKNSLFFVTTLTNNSWLTDPNTTLGNFSEVIMQSVVNIDSVETKDIVQGILHWEHLLETTFSSDQKTAIVKYSKNSPYITKLLCQNIAKNSAADPLLICAQTIRENSYLFETYRLEQSPKGLLLGSQPLHLALSPQESEVLTLLVTNINSQVTRDQIAQSLWGNKSDEKYSDWTIDRLVSNIRTKLSGLNFSGTIKTIKGVGFILSQ